MTVTARILCQASRPAAVLACLLVGVSACLAQAPSKGPIVADILIPPESYQSNCQLSDQQIRSYIKTRVGEPYSQQTASDDLRRLYETHQFSKVEVFLDKAQEEGKVKVYFHLVCMPGTIREILYEGAKHLKEADLDSTTDLRKGQPMFPSKNQQARQNLLRKYREKGRMFASVELIEGTKPTDSRVVFRITEGPVVKVTGVEFRGNSFVSSGRLRTQINSSRSFLGLLGGDFNPEMADNDVIELEKFYKKFGFQDVVVSRDLEWDSSFRAVKLIFHIHEGQRYRVAEVKIGEGARSFSEEKILSVIKLKKDDWYDESVVKEDTNNINALYGYTGRDAHAHQQVIWCPNKGAPGEVLVRYDIMEKQPATVGQIIIVGNEVTRRNVILRQLPLYPGQTLTYPDLAVAAGNLSRLNIFETNQEKGIHPTVEVLDPDNDNPVKDILVNVAETRTGSLMFGVGVNSNAGLTGSIVLNERNFDITKWPTSMEDLLSGTAFRGGGQELRLEAVPGYYLQRYSATWREPFLFDTPNSLTVSAYYYQRYYNEYEEERVGPRITLGRRLNQFWTVSESLRIEDVSVHNIFASAPYDYQSVLGQNLLIGARTSFTRDSRDSYLRATQGSQMELSFEQVTGDYTFPLANIEGSKYFTVYQRADGSGRHVLALRSQLGIAGSHTPVFERYFAGGYNSIRGFQFRGIGPNIDGFMVGGDLLFLNSAEYQVPILANDALYAVGFVDSGTVGNYPGTSGPAYPGSASTYRVTAGFGLRIAVPMLGPVPLALDFGFPIVRAATDRTQVFAFWMGFFH